MRKELYESLPKVTLSSLTEASRAGSTIPVLKQRSYTGKEVIPSALANILCANLGVHGRRGASEKLSLATFFGILSALNSHNLCSRERFRLRNRLRVCAYASLFV